MNTGGGSALVPTSTIRMTLAQVPRCRWNQNAPAADAPTVRTTPMLTASSEWSSPGPRLALVQAVVKFENVTVCGTPLGLLMNSCCGLTAVATRKTNG